MPERRTKSLTINAIEASASEVFCREGYDRASLREIAARAGVSLSSIHEYFDSKTGLYVSVGRLLFHRLESQRRALLRRALEAQGEPSLESVIHCMIAPVVLPEYNGDGLGACASHQLRTWFDTWSVLEEHPQFREMLRESVEDWIAQICASCPGLSARQGRLAYCTITSSMFSWAGSNAYLDEALGISGRLEAEVECRQLVALIASGVRSLAMPELRTRSRDGRRGP